MSETTVTGDNGFMTITKSLFEHEKRQQFEAGWREGVEDAAQELENNYEQYVPCDPSQTAKDLREQLLVIEGPPAAQPADEGKPLKQLRLEGVVSFDWGGEDGGGEIKIGEWGLICEILKLFKSGVKVTIAIMDETFDGELFADVGCGGYSEWTPGDPAELKVGPHNIFYELRRFEGKKVTVVVAEGPVNLLAEEGKP
ncbi:hypothetical protein LCGC14_0441100 [marine sediment metagenome]|uniref:Uncharacterized protein n=1 Tax=marine sediment metagenome TaxID=412755 RepID=A0A0F9VUH5_9ZZZZ